MYFLTQEQIEKLATNSNLERARTYVRSGMIKSLKIINNKFLLGIVSGQKEYRVFIELESENPRGWCTCPYDSKGFCKHKVAVILAWQDKQKIDKISATKMPYIFAIAYKWVNRFISKSYRLRYKF